MRNEFAADLKRRIERDPQSKVMALTGDLGFSVLEPLRECLGDRFLNVGVAEAMMTSVAASMARDGYRVFTYSITPFATFRCLEQIRNDVCYHNLDVTVVGVGAGYGYGTLGPSHHAIEDLACLWSIPNMTVFSPADVKEARLCYEAAWKIQGPKYLRLGKGGEGTLSEPEWPSLEQDPILEYFPGQALTVVTFGNILAEVIPAVSALRAEGHDIQVLSCPWLKPFPGERLVEKISASKVLIVEEVTPYGGFSKQVSFELLHRAPGRFSRVETLGAPDAFAKIVGSPAYQRELAGIDRNAIKTRLKALTDGPVKL